MSASMGNRFDRGAPEQGTRHVIDTAIFELSFGNGMAHWPGELELARIVEKDLMLVVNEVFDDCSPASGAAHIDNLEVDLGSLVFDGSWANVRERLRKCLHAALARAGELSYDGQSAEPGPCSIGVLPATEFDLLEHFLCYGVLPRHTQFRDRKSMDGLLLDAARIEPRRLAALIRDDAVGRDVAIRIARQFPATLVRKVAEALSPREAPVMPELADQLTGRAVDSGKVAALLGRLAEDAGANPDQPRVGSVVRAGTDAPYVPGLDLMLGELERRQPGSLNSLFDKLRSGDVSLASVADGLSTTAHRRLLEGVIVAATQRTGGAPELRQAIDAHAQRVGNERDFYRQVLERLVSDELIDVEAIAASNMASGERDTPRQARGRNAEPDTGEPMPQSPDSERLFRAYDLYAELVEPVQETAGEGARPTGAIDELDRAHPEQFQRLLSELRSGVLSLQPIAARLSDVDLRRLVHGIVTPAAGTADVDRRRFLRSIDDHARRARSKRAFYQRVLQRLVDGERVDPETLAAGTLLPAGQDAPVRDASHGDGVQSGPPDAASNMASGEQDTPRQARRRNAEPDTGEPMPKSPESERLFRAYDLYAELVEPVQETAGEGARPTGAMDELDRAHPEQFQRLLSELRSGVLSLPPIAARFSDVDLRRLVHGIVTPDAETADVDRRRFLRSIDDHARRARSKRAFYQRVLQRLVDGERVDLETLASGTLLPAGQDAPVRNAPHRDAVQTGPPDAGAHISSATPVDADGAEAERVLRDYLGDGAAMAGRGRDEARRAAERFLVREPQQFAGFLELSLKGEAAIARLVGLLPERLLTRALYLLAPAAHAPLQRHADALANVCVSAQTGIAPARVTELKWLFCFQQLLEAEPQWDAGAFVKRFAGFLAGHSDRLDAGQLHDLLRQRLAGAERRGAGDRDFEAPRAPVSPAAAGRAIEPETTRVDRELTRVRENQRLFEQGIRIANAGQILAAPYLPRLFGILGLVEAGAFRGREAQERAVHLLQFMVDEISDTPEYGLVLNKLLCGLDTAASVNRGILVADAEKEAIEGLLRGMIKNWRVLKSTSVNGFRESFLQREGTLRLDGDGWHLSVDPKAYDMLLDRIPWSFSIVRYSWMSEVIYVGWR